VNNSPPLASRGRRLAAWFIDAILGGLVIATPANLLIAVAGGPSVYADTGEGVAIGWWVALPAVATGIGFVALVLFDGGERGATPGKRLLGLRVLDGQIGGSIGYRRAVVRRLVYLVGGIPAYAGWWWVFVDRRRRAWHDFAARSIVVDVRASG
jgi:uncharacterized RDD family membrane protein YckC